MNILEMMNILLIRKQMESTPKFLLIYPVFVQRPEVASPHRAISDKIRYPVIGSRSLLDANATRWRAEVGCFLLLFSKF